MLTLKNYYLIKYPDVGWTIGIPKEFSNSNINAIDMILYSLYGKCVNGKFHVKEY